MAPNYELLLHSEHELSISFFESLDHLLEAHNYTWKFIFTNKLDDRKLEKIKDKISYFSEASVTNHKDILDECVWIISKDQPRANHLRYIISMIYSTKDMDEISKGPKKILDNINFISEISKSLEKIVALYLDIFSKMINLLREKDIEKNYEKSRNLKTLFINEYNKFMEKILNEEIKKSREYYITVYKTVKILDRTIDHLFNIFDNFRFIKSQIQKTSKINLKK
ncbi:MAG: hypothetical protein ACRCVI_00115 [Mycoplasmoidaceae bacterium]